MTTNKETEKHRERHGLPVKLVEEIIKERGSKCQICFCELNTDAKSRRQFHHIIPFRNGGKDKKENLLLLCLRCHNKLESKIHQYEKLAIQKALSSKEKEIFGLGNAMKDYEEENKKLKKEISDLKKCRICGSKDLAISICPECEANRSPYKKQFPDAVEELKKQLIIFLESDIRREDKITYDSRYINGIERGRIKTIDFISEKIDKIFGKFQEEKIDEEKLEKIPLLIIYKQGDKIFAEQPEEIINNLN